MSERKLGEVLEEVKRPVDVVEEEYRILGVRWYAEGAWVKKECAGSEIKAAKLYRVEAGDLIYNRLFAWKGSFAVIPQDLDGCYVSNEFPAFRVRDGNANIHYIFLLLSQPALWEAIERESAGVASISRKRLKVRDFLELELPLPSRKRQVEILDRYAPLKREVQELNERVVESISDVAELRQTILQLAVMGHLVPQDPNDLPAPRSGKHFVYALECDDGSIYIGQTQDVVERWKQHAAGQGADWTRKHAPIRLVHWEEFDSLEEAVQREKDLKTGFGRKWLKREIAAGRTRQAGEPASVLLARIQGEKQHLVTEGQIRKGKSLQLIGSEERPHELPVGWEWVRLGEVGAINPRNTAFDDKMAGFVPMSLVFDTFGSYPQHEERPWGEIKKGYTHFADGDVVLAKITPCFENGKAGVMRGLPNGFGAGTTELHVVRPIRDHVVPEYVWIFFKSPRFREVGEAQMTGTAGQKRIPKAYVESSLLPLPPLAEQKRIVAKVDQLMTLCDDLEAKLQQAQQDADNLLTAIVHELVGSSNGRQE